VLAGFFIGVASFCCRQATKREKFGAIYAPIAALMFFVAGGVCIDNADSAFA
jgi:hypothetical protein